MTTGMPQADAAPAVRVEQVTRRFSGGVTAVDRVSLTVAQGEILCLLGPSGSGKTTLLRIIAGFETADEGRIILMNEDVTRVAPAQRRTNMVFQHHALFPHLNVHDNIAFGLRMRRVAEAQITTRVTDVLDLVQLAGYQARKIDQLSGGQRQRVAIARAIVNDPAVLLLDEPLGALDLRLRVQLQEELRRLQRSLGSPFIVVTHDQNEAMALADRIAVMNEGRIEQVGTPDDIYNRPASLFVAQFVGHTNLLSGVAGVARGDGGFAVEVCGLTVPCRATPGVLPGSRITMSVREELVRLNPAAIAAEQCSLEGTIVDRVFLGSLIKYGIALNDRLTITAETHAVGGPGMLAVGSRVHVAWEISQAPVFAAT